MDRYRGRGAEGPPVRGPLTVFRNGGVANNDVVDAAIRHGAEQAGCAPVNLLGMHDLGLPQDAADADWIRTFCQWLAAEGIERGIVVSTDRGRGDGLNPLLESLRGTPLVWIAMPKSSGTQARPRTIQERADRLRAELPKILAREEVPLMVTLNMGPTGYHHPDCDRIVRAVGMETGRV